jgi:hypothetical protein
MDSHSSGITHNHDRTAEDAILRILHRTAQPLSTVRGILELTLAEAMTADEKKAWLQQAMEQLLQATSTFEQLRQLVETKRYGRPSTETRTVAHV